MKRNQVKAILTNQTKRRNTVLMFICTIVIVSIAAFSFFLTYFNQSKKQYVTYDETSKIDYKVFLEDNDFFDNNYLGTDNNYIASLIKYINTDFSYKLSLKEKNVEYKYSYRIEANVSVKEKGTSNPLYNTDQILVGEKEYNSSLNEVTINENINIDYKYYNDLIKKFINIYGLDNVESILTINMFVNVIGSCEDFEKNGEQESIISLSIPLTTKTVAIDISNNLTDVRNNVMQCKNIYPNSFIFMLLGSIFVILDLCLIIITIRYEIKTRTAENIYERELKKILNNYSSYIQTLGDDFDFKSYQLLKVDTFNDMLEIRDTIKQPILMKENKDKTGAYFVIPSNTKILYVYRLKVCNIKKGTQK